MGIIYTPNILKHWFTDSLYDTPTFQKLWHVIDFIFFSNFYTSMAKQTPAMLPIMGEEAVVTNFAFLLIWNFVLLVTPDITPVLSNNDAIKSLSAVRYFFKKKLQEEASLCPHEKPSIKHFLLQQESKQTKASLKNCVCLCLLPR